jgi:hypothetical protein
VFPTLVYKSGGPHFGPPGTTYSYRGVKNAAELEAALEDGFQLTLPKAVGLEPADPKPSEMRAKEEVKSLPAAPVPPADLKPMSREELDDAATQLGIKVDGRWSDEKVAKLVEDALKAKG